MSESRDDGDRRYEGSQSDTRQSGSGQSDGRPKKPASDPVADFQRWLMRAGARSMAHQVADNVRRTLGQQRRDSKGSGDVWDTATTELPPDEPPECQWCPVCQAARRLRESGPGLGAKLADAGGVLAGVLQDTFSAVDQMIKTQSSSSERHPESPSLNGADAAHTDAAAAAAQTNPAQTEEASEENAPS